MKVLTIIFFLVLSFTTGNFKIENPIVEKEGYYFSIASNTKLGNSNIWVTSYYNGFIDEKRWNEKQKVRICSYNKSVPKTFDLVREENEFMIEEDFLERIIMEKETKTAEIRTLLQQSENIFKQSGRKNITFRIVYGNFKFIKNKGKMKEYEERISSHSHRGIGVISGEEKIQFFDLVNYDNLRRLSNKESEKVKIKRNCY